MVILIYVNREKDIQERFANSVLIPIPAKLIVLTNSNVTLPYQIDWISFLHRRNRIRCSSCLKKKRKQNKMYTNNNQAKEAKPDRYYSTHYRNAYPSYQGVEEIYRHRLLSVTIASNMSWFCHNAPLRNNVWKHPPNGKHQRLETSSKWQTSTSGNILQMANIKLKLSSKKLFFWSHIQ